MLSHVVSVVIGQGLATDSTSENAFLIPVNHGLDYSIQT